MEENKSKELLDKVCEQVHESITNISNEGIHVGNIDYLGKLIDIKKDIANMNYWKTKEENMRTNYGRNVYGRDEYYRGERMMDDMYQGYREYSDGRNAYNNGNYGAKQDTLESLNYMLQSVVEFMGMLKEEAGTKEEVDLIKRYAQTLSDM